jgi:hypothetical protein
MLEIFQLIGDFLERCERENSRIFWVVTVCLGLTFSSLDDQSSIRFQTTKSLESPAVSSVLAINSGGGEKAPKSKSFVFQIGLRKKNLI